MENKTRYSTWAILMFACVVLLSGSAQATTSTVSGALYFDKTTVTSGEKVNFSVLGLDKDGAVDLYGEESGATILATLTSQLGTFGYGGADPGAASGGEFSAQVKYLKLAQGVAKNYISYGSTVSGTDTLKVVLQEKYQAEGGGYVYKTIATFSQQITVNKAASTATKALRFVSSYNGKTEAKTIYTGTKLIAGETGLQVDGTTDGIEVGKAGAQLTFWAVDGSGNLDTSANGTLKVTLWAQKSDDWGNAGASTPYTFDVTMSAGVAILTLTGDSVKSAGYYWVKAETEGFSAAMSSVQWNKQDYVQFLPKSENYKLELVTEKSVISDDGKDYAGTDARVYMLDEYGNKTSISATNANKDLKLTDGNSVFATSTSLFTKPSSTQNYWSTTLGNASSKPTKVGTASLQVAINDKQSVVKSSDATQLIVRDKNLYGESNSDSTDTYYQKPVPAGISYNAFLVGIDENATGSTSSKFSSQTAVTIKHYVDGKLKETTTSNVAAGEYLVKAQFTKASGSVNSDEYFIVGDSDGEYGETKIDADTGTSGKIVAGSAKTGKILNGNNESSTTWPYDSKSGDTYNYKVNEKQVKLFDSYGNAIPSTESGAVSVSTSNGTVSYNSGTSLTPNGVTNNYVEVSYDSTKFTGTDKPKFIFTEPNVDPIEMSATVPGKGTLTTLVLNSVAGSQSTLSADTVNLPLNAVIPVTAEALDQNGKRIDDKTVVISFSGTVAPAVMDCKANPVANGQILKFDSATTGSDGRHVLTVTAPNKTGSFTITLKNAAGTVTTSKEFVVTTNITPIEDVGKETGTTEKDVNATTIVNLYINTTNPDEETPVYEWFVFTATIGGQQLPLYLLSDNGIAEIVPGLDLYQYTYTYSGDVQKITSLSMSDLGLSSGDTFAYAYAYQNEAGDILLPNVVVLTVK